MKKLLSILMTLLLVVSSLGSVPTTIYANEEPTYIGPNDSDHAYLDFHSNGENYSFYFMGEIGDASLEGVSYDLESNTLTLTDYNEPSTIIEASEMGSDFKIVVNGENNIKAITVFADRYMGSLSIEGEGSLSINGENDYDDVPIYLDANSTDSVFKVEDTVKLSVCANSDDLSVKVLNSNIDDSIISANTEYRISSCDESSSQNKWINAHDTQMNTFWAVKDSDCYTTLCWDEFAQDSLYYEFVLVKKVIDGEEVVFADPTMDDMGNPNIISSENVDNSKSIIACQIMNQYERAAVEKVNDETEYTLTEYTSDGEGPFWDVYKVIHDEDLGPFFYLVAEKLTVKPEEYTPVQETINNKYVYIEGNFENYEKEGPSNDDIYFSANVKGSAITYHDGDNLYIEKGKTELISFDLFDDNDVPYVSAWYSIDMAEQGFEIAPYPVVIDDIYYASITNNTKIENSGTLIINAFSGEKFADPAFDFVTTEPDATFTLNIISVDKYEGVVCVGDKTYQENSVISINPGETIKVYYNVPNYPGFAMHIINPEPMIEAGFEFEQLFDEEEIPYAIITAGKNLVPGTKAYIPLSIKRFEDCIMNDFDFSITPSVYEYVVSLEVAGKAPCEHKYDNGVVTKQPTTSAEGVKTYTCTVCGYTKAETIAKLTDTTKPELKVQEITTAKIKSYKASALKKKAVKINLKAKASGKGKLTYKVKSTPKGMKKFITVSKTGVVTLKKNAKKGTYKITITAAAKGSYKKTTKVVSIKVK